MPLREFKILKFNIIQNLISKRLNIRFEKNIS